MRVLPVAGVRVEFRVEKSIAVIKIGSLKLRLEPKSITVETKPSRITTGRGSGVRGYLYVAFPMKLLPGETGSVESYVKSFVEGSFMFQVINTCIGSYIVVVTPGSYSYERIIVHGNTITIEHSMKLPPTSTSIEHGKLKITF